jgi:hypothetical protein
LNQQAMVGGFLPSFGSVPTLIASVAVAYDDPTTYETFILIFHQCLLFDELPNHLLCPFQMQMNDVIVNDNPLSTLIWSNRYPELRSTNHSIVTLNTTLHIPHNLHGVMSYFETRKPTIAEIEDSTTYPHIIMTYDMPHGIPTILPSKMLNTSFA